MMTAQNPPVRPNTAFVIPMIQMGGRGRFGSIASDLRESAACATGEEISCWLFIRSRAFFGMLIEKIKCKQGGKQKTLAQFIAIRVRLACRQLEIGLRSFHLSAGVFANKLFAALFEA
jgi:hypothetical protein